MFEFEDQDQPVETDAADDPASGDDAADPDAGGSDTTELLVEAAEPALPAVDVEEIDRGDEPVKAQPKDTKAAKPAAKSDPKDPAADGLSTWKLLDGEFPDVPELNFDGFYEKLEAKHIQKMDPFSKRIMHNMRIEWLKARNEIESYKEKLDRDHQVRLHALADREREIAVENRRLRAWVNDPKVQAILKASTAEVGDVDPLTADGQRKLIEQQVTKAIAATIAPADEAFKKTDQEVRYLEFKKAHPDEMGDETFKSEMAALVKERAASGAKISLDDAFAIVRGRRLSKEAEANKAATLAARRKSQERIAHKTTAAAATPSGIPKEIVKQGAVAINQWLTAHPKDAKQIRAAQRGQ